MTIHIEEKLGLKGSYYIWSDLNSSKKDWINATEEELRQLYLLLHERYKYEILMKECEE
jgi:hypothetical protein